jgi:hypothetical protein
MWSAYRYELRQPRRAKHGHLRAAIAAELHELIERAYSVSA